MEPDITEEEALRNKIDAIIAFAWDAEKAHGKEDELHIEIINRYAPQWVVDEVKRLSDAGFPRWCA